jgi:hypothetical protein
MRFMKTQRSLFLLLLSLSVLCHIAMAQISAKLNAYFWGPTESTCDSSETGAFLCGGSYALRLQLISPARQQGDTSGYSGVTDWNWPNDLTIQADATTDISSAFDSTSSVTASLHLYYYVDYHALATDSLWRADGYIPPPPLDIPHFNFGFSPPADLAGKYLRFNVSWNHPTHGQLKLRRLVANIVVEPCSQVALDHMWSTWIYIYGDRGQFDSAISLADSLINVGWHDPMGLLNVIASSMAAKRYNDAIHFLDDCFSFHHTIAFDPSDGYKTYNNSYETDSLIYNRARAHLLEQMEQQKHR